MRNVYNQFNTASNVCVFEFVYERDIEERASANLVAHFNSYIYSVVVVVVVAIVFGECQKHLLYVYVRDCARDGDIRCVQCAVHMCVTQTSGDVRAPHNFVLQLAVACGPGHKQIQIRYDAVAHHYT